MTLTGSENPVIKKKPEKAGQGLCVPKRRAPDLKLGGSQHPEHGPQGALLNFH